MVTGVPASKKSQLNHMYMYIHKPTISECWSVVEQIKNTTT